MNRQQRRAAQRTAKAATNPLLPRAVELHQAGRLDDAARLYRQVLAAEPRNPDALHLSGLILYQTGDAAAAAERIGRAIAVNDRNPLYHGNLGNALRDLGRVDEAVAAYRRALALAPDYFVASNNLGIALHDLGLFDEAEACYQTALRLAPNYADAHSNLGVMLRDLRRADEAAQHLGEALRLDPANAVAHMRMGFVARDRGDHAEALRLFDRAHALKPDLADAEAQAHYVRLYVCDWSALDGLRAFLARLGAAGNAGAGDPFVSLAVPGLGPASLKAMVEARVHHTFAPHAKERRALDWRWERAPRPKLRLGYLSADFHTHPTTALLAEVIELHDRDRFETVAYSLGPDDGSAMRGRIVKAFDRFHDLAAPAPRAAAERIHRDQVDILIDINGFTRAGRVDIVAYRPAPIQVNYLGFPGSMGADFIDYIVADDFICPPGSDVHYTEAIARLPDTYQPNDRKRAAAPAAPSRRDCGLPETGFVFCCFNNSFKITPDVFGVWMSLLAAVPGSTLWLLEDTALAKANLRSSAAARGVAPERLVFAARIAPELHLARHVYADLFLDTLPYNAHTTASDALWMGLPVVTCAGDTFAGRVAGSLLRAVGLPQCIVGNLDDYRRLALALAEDRAKLEALRAHLAAVRDTCALFDSRRYTRNLERLYEAMWQNWLAGRPPAPITLETK